MGRSRAWRRYKQDTKVKIRLKNIIRRSSWYHFTDINDIRLYNPEWMDLIGSATEHMFKTMTTHSWDSRYKNKWGKKGKRNYDYSGDPFTRIKDKESFRRLLIEILNELE